MVNSTALNALPAASAETGLEAQLETPTGPITLLYNPEAISYQRAAEYSEAATAGSSVSAQQLIRATGRSMELADLLLDSRCAGRTLRPLLEGLEALLLPPKQAVYFNWGAERFGPAVVSSMTWSVTSWLGGEPVQAQVSLSLLQDLPVEVAPTPNPTGNIALTARQQAEGSTRAELFLNENFARLPVAAQSVINGNRANFSAATDGTVELLDDLGESLGKVGTWTGFEFNDVEDLFN